MVSFDILGPLPEKKNVNKYILLIKNLFSRHAEPYALSAEEKTAKGCASKLANEYVTTWGCPKLLLSDRGAEVTVQVAKQVYAILGSKKRLSSAFHPHTNGCVERLNHTVCQMLSHVVSSRHNDCDEYLLQLVYAHNNHISRVTGLAPNEVHVGRYPRIPITLLSSQKQIRGVQSLKRDELDYLQLMRDKRHEALNFGRESDRMIKKKHRQNNAKIADIMHKRPVYEVGQWMWVYNEQHTLKAATGQRVLDKEAIKQRIKVKLANMRTGPYKILGVGPCRVGQRFVRPKLLYLDMPFQNMTKPRVSVLRCKRCFQPHEKGNKHRFMPWQFRAYVLNNFSELAPPFYLPTDHVDIERDSQRAKPLKIKAHRLNRGPGGTLNVQFDTVWRGH